jgi:tRNA threonylcarbamoyladenosine biosynthesis protein TsaE
MNRTVRSVAVTTSAEETRRLGEAAAARLRSGACVALVGPLGAGKTEWVRGACRGLGVDEAVLSPTFVLLEEFRGRFPVAHIDLYRLDHESEIEALGVFDMLGGDTVILAEWADRSETLMESADVVVTIEDAGVGTRRIEVACTPPLAGAFEGMDAWL